jgi:phage recombination protein Bet
MNTKTAEKNDPEAGHAVAVFSPPRLPYNELVTERYPEYVPNRSAWKALVEAVYPGAKTVDSVVMVLSYCKARNLDPFKKPVHIVPMYSAQLGRMVETVWPGISELRTTAFRTGEYAGCEAAEFGPIVEHIFEGMVDQWENRTKKSVKVSKKVAFPEWCRITLYRSIKGTICKFVGPKVVWLEDYATLGNSDVPNEMWTTRAEGQLEKCAEAAALRRAFPEEIGGQLSAEEMEGKRVYQDPATAARDVTPAATPPAPPAPPPPPPPTPKAETPKAEPEIIPPEPPKPNRKERQQKGADEAKAAAKAKAEAPAPEAPADPDPEALLKFVEATLAAVEKAEDLESAWNENIEPRMPDAFPPDREEAAAIYRKHEQRLGID